MNDEWDKKKVMMALAVTIAAVSQHGNGDGETDTFSKQQLEEQ